MYLDFEDHRPDPPRVPSVITRREGILLSLVAHLVSFIVIVLSPAPAPAPDDAITPATAMSEDDVQFVYMEPLFERPATPRPGAEFSDLDRRATTPEPVPSAELPTPVSEGNTPEKVVGAPEERAAGPEGPVTPPTPDPAATPTSTSEAEPLPLPGPSESQTRLNSGQLGDSLRDLQRYLRDENYANPQGGLIENGPDIQFDSRGVEFGPWLRRFVAQLKSNWNVPLAAATNRGNVVLQFHVHKNGTITELSVARPSDIAAFTTSAMNAVRLSNPTLPLPPEYPLSKALFTVTFRYNERDVPSVPPAP